MKVPLHLAAQLRVGGFTLSFGLGFSPSPTAELLPAAGTLHLAPPAVPRRRVVSRGLPWPSRSVSTVSDTSAPAIPRRPAG